MNGHFAQLDASFSQVVHDLNIIAVTVGIDAAQGQAALRIHIENAIECREFLELTPSDIFAAMLPRRLTMLRYPL
jgi:hypothetical protein